MKLQEGPESLFKLRKLSDEICMEYGLTILEPYEKQSDSKSMDTREYRAQIKGESWKIELAAAIDKAMASSNNKKEFISAMNEQGYLVKWEDNHKHITYTTPDGIKCRDNKLHDEKYLKVQMESYFENPNALNVSNIVSPSSRTVELPTSASRAALGKVTDETIQLGAIHICESLAKRKLPIGDYKSVERKNLETAIEILHKAGCGVEEVNRILNSEENNWASRVIKSISDRNLKKESLGVEIPLYKKYWESLFAELGYSQRNMPAYITKAYVCKSSIENIFKSEMQERVRGIRESKEPFNDDGKPVTQIIEDVIQDKSLKTLIDEYLSLCSDKELLRNKEELYMYFEKIALRSVKEIGIKSSKLEAICLNEAVEKIGKGIYQNSKILTPDDKSSLKAAVNILHQAQYSTSVIVNVLNPNNNEQLHESIHKLVNIFSEYEKWGRHSSISKKDWDGLFSDLGFSKKEIPKYITEEYVERMKTEAYIKSEMQELVSYVKELRNLEVTDYFGETGVASIDKLLKLSELVNTKESLQEEKEVLIKDISEDMSQRFSLDMKTYKDFLEKIVEKSAKELSFNTPLITPGSIENAAAELRMLLGDPAKMITDKKCIETGVKILLQDGYGIHEIESLINKNSDPEISESIRKTMSSLVEGEKWGRSITISKKDWNELFENLGCQSERIPTYVTESGVEKAKIIQMTKEYLQANVCELKEIKLSGVSVDNLLTKLSKTEKDTDDYIAIRKRIIEEAVSDDDIKLRLEKYLATYSTTKESMEKSKESVFKSLEFVVSRAAQEINHPLSRLTSECISGGTEVLMLHKNIKLEIGSDKAEKESTDAQKAKIFRAAVNLLHHGGYSKEEIGRLLNAENNIEKDSRISKIIESAKECERWGRTQIIPHTEWKNLFISVGCDKDSIPRYATDQDELRESIQGLLIKELQAEVRYIRQQQAAGNIDDIQTNPLYELSKTSIGGDLKELVETPNPLLDQIIASKLADKEIQELLTKYKLLCGDNKTSLEYARKSLKNSLKYTTLKGVSEISRISFLLDSKSVQSGLEALRKAIMQKPEAFNLKDIENTSPEVLKNLDTAVNILLQANLRYEDIRSVLNITETSAADKQLLRSIAKIEDKKEWGVSVPVYKKDWDNLFTSLGFGDKHIPRWLHENHHEQGSSSNIMSKLWSGAASQIIMDNKSLQANAEMSRRQSAKLAKNKTASKEDARKRKNQDWEL